VLCVGNNASAAAARRCMKRAKMNPLAASESNSQKHSAPATLARSPKSNRSHTIKNYPWLLMLLSLQHSLRDPIQKPRASPSVIKSRKTAPKNLAAEQKCIVFNTPLFRESTRGLNKHQVEPDRECGWLVAKIAKCSLNSISRCFFFPR
jgi:hypothetical protein